MIWMFDSGFWWLTVLREFVRLMPEYDYLYLADSARAPYGTRDPETILRFSIECTRFLFEQWAKIVIIACNTATANAIRPLQQIYFPDKKILWVTIPWAEKVIEAWYKKIWVIATSSTVKQKAYRERVHILDTSIEIQELDAPLLVPLIEAGEHEYPEADMILERYLARFDSDIEALVLGCTHYPILIDRIRKIIGPNIKIIDPGTESAEKFVTYLKNHPEIEQTLQKSGKRKFFSTWDPEKFRELGSKFVGFPIEQVEQISF